VKNSDQIVVLEKGKIVEAGTRTELCATRPQERNSMNWWDEFTTNWASVKAC
jgi:ABC-type multidrug transport system fused ATPase/permease subunit